MTPVGHATFDFPRNAVSGAAMVDRSTRIRTLLGTGDDGWDLFYRARQMEAEGIAVANLTIGEHDTRTHPSILEEMSRAAARGHTGYAAVPGTDALRYAIAARVTSRTQVATARENVLVTPGGQAALFAALMGTLDPGDEVLIPDPYYTTYPGTVRAAGGVPVFVPCRPEAGFAPEAAALNAAVTNRTRAILINTPNNPTGAAYGADTLADIFRVAEAHDLWVISDEVYDTQTWITRHRSFWAVPGARDRTLLIGSMSKSHAMTGSRIGWLLGPEAMVADLINLSTHTTYGVPGYIQDAATYALSMGPTFEDTVALPFRRRRDACLARLDGHPVLRAQAPGGGMYLMLDIRKTGQSAPTFASRLLTTHHIAVMPGDSFGHAAAGHVRVALTLPDAQLMPAFDQILSFAEEIAP